MRGTFENLKRLEVPEENLEVQEEVVPLELLSGSLM